jgi:maleamate amidohydrolase
MRNVILLVDLINDSFKDDLPQNPKMVKPNLIEKVKELIAIARSKEWPIIWVKEQYKEDRRDMPRGRRKKLEKKENVEKAKFTIEGEKGAQFLDGLDYQPAKDDTVVKKNYSAFFGTDLCKILKEKSKEESSLRIIIGGVNTQACIYATAMDAFQRDHDVILAEDCISSYDQEFHAVSLRYLGRSIGEILNNKEIEKEQFPAN